jgi:photosystem II stability/assembly factor-like uncharacterized protein
VAFADRRLSRIEDRIVEYRRRALLMTLACGGWSLGRAAGAAPVADPAERAATASPKATVALLTAVTRAGDRLVAVGERGIVLLSDDNGVTWQQAASPVSVMLTGVRFASERVGWAVGHSGIVLKTNNGGTNWTRQLDGVQAAQLTLDSAKDRAARDTDATSQAEVAEAKRLLRDGADKPFLDLLVTNDQDCLVVGAYGQALRTRDGGRSWQSWKSRLPNPKGGHLYGVQAADKTVYVAGEMGLVLRSDDGGERFARLQTPYEGSFFGLLATGPERALVFGLNGNAFATEDGGARWVRVDVGTSASLSGALRLDGGETVLTSFAGNLRLARNQSSVFVALEAGQQQPVVGLAQARDGALVVVGARGPKRVAAESIAKALLP